MGIVACEPGMPRKGAAFLVGRPSAVVNSGRKYQSTVGFSLCIRKVDSVTPSSILATSEAKAVET